MKIEFTVPGVPVGKARPRVTMTHTYTPKKTKDYEKHVRECWMEQSNKRFPKDVPLEMNVVAYFPIPKSVSKKKHTQMVDTFHTHRPDIDNVCKIAADSVLGCAYEDDSQIAVMTGVKRYSDYPRLEVTISEL